MAFLHLVNCLLLSLVPLFLVFNTSSVHEYGFRVCFEGLFGFIVTSFVKFFVYATVMGDPSEWVLAMELAKECISLLDIYAFVRLYRRKGVRYSDKKTKIVGIALGWAIAEIVLSNAFIFLFNASGGEFTWEYLQRALKGNFRVLLIMCMSALVWVYTEKRGTFKVLAQVLLPVIVCVLPFAVNYAEAVIELDSWVLVGAEGVVALTLGVATKIIVELALVSY